MTYSSKHLFHIDAPREKVFNAISSIDGLANWWTVQTTGTDGADGQIHFQFGDHGGPIMKVTEYIPNEKLSWECSESPHGWQGHTYDFRLDDNEGKTRVRFSHNGFPEQDEFFAICNFSWGRYMESLRQYCQTGNGEAFGSPGYR